MIFNLYSIFNTYTLLTYTYNIDKHVMKTVYIYTVYKHTYTSTVNIINCK